MTTQKTPSEELDIVVEELWLRALDMTSDDFKNDKDYQKAQSNYYELSKAKITKLIEDSYNKGYSQGRSGMQAAVKDASDQAKSKARQDAQWHIDNQTGIYD